MAGDGADGSGSERVSGIRFTFPDVAVSATARLLRDLAPATCAEVVAALPVEGEARHGIYSGAELLVFMSPEIRVGRENASSDVAVGDVAYYWFRGGTALAPDDAARAEIAWFYAPGAVPSMRDGPVAVNVFARFEPHGWERFAAVCGELEPGGARPVRIEAVAGSSRLA